MEEGEKADTWRQAHDRLMEENLALKQQPSWIKVIALEAQLATERENSTRLACELSTANTQLAAEREKVGKVQELVLRRDAEIAQLTSKLAGIDKQLFAEAIPKSYEPDRTLVIEQLQQQLAAEREKHPMEACRNPLIENKELLRDIKQLQQQLAAERENYQRTVTDFLKCHAVETEEGVRMLAQRSFELHECQKQLAAEKELRKRWERKTEETLTQLAAEREWFQEMEDKWQALAASRYNEAKQLRAQLAAERAEVSRWRASEPKFDKEKHHPSCSAHDQDLVWRCAQCGHIESAANIENQLDAEREKATS